MSKISIIIRCLNEEKYIGKLLTRICNQTVKDIEIVVVDSGSTDQTLEIVAQYPTKLVKIRPEEFSFGRALNIGCAAASGDLLLFASAHVYPIDEYWVAKIMQPFKDEKVALVYGKQRGNETTKFSEHQVFEKWFPNISNYDQKHPFCNNANCAIRKSLWEEQAYDETLLGLEDLDWAKKIQAKGWKIAYETEATIIHVHEEPWKSVYNRYRREAIAFRLIMKYESFNFWQFLKLLSLNWKADFRSAVEKKKLSNSFSSIFMFRLMQFWGTYRGYKQSYLLDNEVRERFYYPKGYLEK